MEPLFAIRLDDEVLELPGEKMNAIMALAGVEMQAQNAELLLVGLIGERAKDIAPKLMAWAKAARVGAASTRLPMCYQARGVMLMDDAGVWHTVCSTPYHPIRVVVGC